MMTLPIQAVKIAVIASGVLMALGVGSSILGLTAARRELAAARVETAGQDQRILANQKEPNVLPVVSLPEVVEEDKAFYSEFREWCRTAKVRVVSWDSAPPALAANPAGRAQALHDDSSTEGVSAKGVTVVLDASYDALRELLGRIDRAPRLLNITGVEWRRTTPERTQLTLTIIRYISSGPTPSGDGAS